MNRYRRSLLVAGLLALLIAGGMALDILPAPDIGPAQREAAPSFAFPPHATAPRRPDFALTDLQGQMHHVREWDGSPLVVNFWATWCTPCRREIPAFNTLQAQYRQQGVHFVGIALDDPDAVAEFIQEIPINYTVLVGEAAGIQIARDFGNHDGILPYTVFIAADGTIASIARGRITKTTAETQLQELL